MAKKLPFEEFKQIYAKVPRLCVDLVIKTNKGTLLTLRNIEPGKGLWHFPGGTVLLDETVEEAIHWVAQEEIGVGVSIEKLLGIIDFYQTESELYGHTVSLVYFVALNSEDFKLNAQATKVKFFTSLPQKMIIEHRQFLEKNQLV